MSDQHIPSPPVRWYFCTSFAQNRLFRALFYRDGVSIFSVLQNADFRNLWFGQMISFLGDALAFNTLNLAVIHMANAADASYGKILAALMVFSALPALFLGIIAGTLADRANRKRIMIGADLIRGFLVLGYLIVQDFDHIWIYVVVSVALNSVSVFFYPARTALLPQILSKAELLPANAMAQLTQTISYVVGAAAAGFLVGGFGATAPSFLADSLTFFASAYFIARISVSGRVERPAEARAIHPPLATVSSLTQRAENMLHNTLYTLRTIADELYTGLRYVLTDQVMRGVLISFLAMMLGLGAANVTFVALLMDELGMREEGLGLVRFSQTLGIIISSATVTASLSKRYTPGTIIGSSIIAFGISTIIVSVIDNYTIMVLVLFAVGLTIAPPQIVAATLMQHHVPGEKLGRASGVQGTLTQVANILSMGAAGLLLDEIGARWVFAISGLIIFSAGFVSWWVLRNVKAEDDPPTVGDATTAPAPPNPAPTHS